MSTSESSRICRLCGHSCEQYIDIFSRLDCVNMLQYKIKHLIDIAVSRGDNLSHSVCLSCVSKLENLWCFRNTCHQVQIELRKMNQSLTNYDRLKSELAMRHSNLLLNLGLGKNDSTSRPILGDEVNFNKLSNDVSKQNSTVNSDVHSDSSPEADASLSNDIETTLIDTRNFDSEISYGDDDNDDYYCNNEEKYSISITSGDDMDCNNFPISKITEDNMCDSFPKSKKQSDKKSTITLSATSSSGIKKFLEHNYRMEVDVNSDFLCNRFSHLLVESKMGSKHMIYTVFPDLSKFDYEHDYKVNFAGEYLTSETFDLKNPNITRTLIQWINKLLKGEISLMPYYSSWLDKKQKLNLILKCILCKKIMNGDRQSIMNHVADHLMCICPVCGTLCRSICSFKNHLHKHESVTLKCSTCNENFGSDFEKFKVHKRSHYKFECFSCQFECSDKEEWLKHLKKDRKEYCSSDCCLFYGSIEELQEHVSELSTIGGFVCGACGMAYHSEEYLKLHLRVHGLQHGSNTTSRSTCNSTGTAPQIKHSKKFIDGLKNSSLDKHFDTLKSILDNKIDLNKFQTSSTGPGGNVITGFMCFKCSEILTNEKKFRIHIGNHFMMTCDASLCKRYIKGTAKLGEHFKRCIFKRRICVICKNDVWLETTTEYLEHLSLHQKRRICIYCQVVFPTAQNLDTHVRTNHNKNKTEDGFKHFCELCNETLVVSYKSFESFKINHFKENHPDQLEWFVCDICGEKFDRKCHLNSHTNSKHAGKSYKNNDKFICAYCSKEFANKHTVKSHIRQHMNEKGFKCDICNKGFNRETSLIKHKLDMHSVKKHLCNLCGKRFTYPSALKDHAERAHAYVRSTGSKRKSATKHPISTEDQESTSSEEPANNSHSITTATRDHGSALYEFPYTIHHPQDYVTSFEASLDTSHATMAQD